MTSNCIISYVCRPYGHTDIQDKQTSSIFSLWFQLVFCMFSMKMCIYAKNRYSFFERFACNGQQTRCRVNKIINSRLIDWWIAFSKNQTEKTKSCSLKDWSGFGNFKHENQHEWQLNTQLTWQFIINQSNIAYIMHDWNDKIFVPEAMLIECNWWFASRCIR